MDKSKARLAALKTENLELRRRLRSAMATLSGNAAQPQAQSRDDDDDPTTVYLRRQAMLQGWRSRIDPLICGLCSKRLGVASVDNGVHRYHPECWQERNRRGLV
jgi:hypothetical protein